MENKKSPDFTLQVNETYSSTVATIAPGLKIFSKHQFLQEVCWMLSKITTTKSYKYIKIYVKKKHKTFWLSLHCSRLTDFFCTDSWRAWGFKQKWVASFLILSYHVLLLTFTTSDCSKTFHNAVIQHCAPSSAVVEDKFQESRVPLSKLLI